MDWLIVEWLILVLVTPVVITVVVLLYGFVGCGSLLPSAQPSNPPKPDKLTARAAASNLVKLTWQNTAGTAVTFTVERIEEGTGKTDTFNVPGSVPALDDGVGLKEGTTYFYKVRTVVAGLASDPSDQSAATTFPEAPADVDPRPTEINRIDLTWTNKSATASKVIVQNESPTGVFTETKTDADIAQPRQFNVDEGSEHKFRLAGPQQVGGPCEASEGDCEWSVGSFSGLRPLGWLRSYWLTLLCQRLIQRRTGGPTAWARLPVSGY